MSYVPPLLHPSHCLSSPQSSPGESPSGRFPAPGSQSGLYERHALFFPLDVIKFFVIKPRASLVSSRESRNKKDQLYLCPPQVDVNAECKLTDI